MKLPTKKDQADSNLETGHSKSVLRTPSTRRSCPQDEELSPAGTFDTALTSPSTFDESVRSPHTPQKITFEHHVKTTSSSARSAGLLLGMTKPALGIVGLLILGTGAAAAFGWFQIPGLSNQIDELEAQVAQLSGEVDRLSAENDRYETLNDKLNQTVAEFRDLNQDLNDTVTELESISDGLNSTRGELLQRVRELTTENENYARMNRELNNTAARLAQEVDFFELALSKLVLENGALSNLTESLQGITTEFGTLTEEQNKTLLGLYDVLNGLTSENERLESLNNDLVKIVTFLNETSLGLDNSLQQVSAFLADQITVNQVLVLASLENTYRQKVQTWDCDYRDHFAEESFGQDFNVLISNITQVVDYIDERVLSEICLNKSDFQQYLRAEFPEGLNSFRLMRGVNDYALSALNYYFPQANQTGVSPDDWADASYDCQKLQEPFSRSAAI